MSRLPGILFIAIAVIGLIPSVSRLQFIQDHISMVGGVVLGLVGLLGVIAPNRIVQIASISMAEANMKLKEKNLKEREAKVALLEQHYHDAMNAVDASNVNAWLDSRIMDFYWCGLKEQYLPYIVAKVEVSSRFLFDLLFVDGKPVNTKLTLNSDVIAQEAMLIEAQKQWQDPEEARESHSPIKATSKNNLYLRFQINSPIKEDLMRYLKEQREIKLSLFFNWELKPSNVDRKVNYTPSESISGGFKVTLWQ